CVLCFVRFLFCRCLCFFFFQAEDGIRDFHVTGVQTCALPILNRMAVNLGFSVGPALGGFLAMISYSWIFYGNAIAALSAAVVFLIFFRNRKPRSTISTRRKQEKTFTKKDRNAYLDVPFIIFNIFCCLFSMAFFQLLSTVPLYY